MAIPFTVAEYFAGIGLVRLGLEMAGWRIVFANDISDKKAEMYKAFFPERHDHYVIRDVFELDPAAIPPAMLATCSFPCIDLSLAGNMNGISDGKHSSAFWGFTRILKAQAEKAPPIVMVENVPGWLYSNNGADFRLTVQALNDLGYSCDIFTLDALRFTAQSRLRVFLIGVKGASSTASLEQMLCRPQSLLSDAMRKSLLINTDLKWIYLEIPAPPPLKRNGLSEIVEQFPDDDRRWWSQDEVDRHLRMMNKTHYDRVVELCEQDEVAYRTFYRRRRNGFQRAEVRDDDLSGCLRTAVGGSGKQFLIKISKGNIKMRTMTPREYARLQGVPDSYPITVNDVQALTGFGDAVCVPAIAWIGQHVLNPIAQELEYA
ncbi:MAG: Modification methylase HpaII [Chloroflexi bacterium ADurb.Bin325]|nr:MAG: Modification methylase HpaII [Chloroflexi bacterium ADurb.Bin325]